MTDQPLATERATAQCSAFGYRLSLFSEFDAQTLVRTCFGSRAQTSPVSVEYDWHVVGSRVEVEGVVVTGDGVDESIRRCIEFAMRATGRDFKEEDRPSFERFHLSSKVRPPRVQRPLRLRLAELIADIDAGVRPPTDDDLEELRQLTVDFPDKAIPALTSTCQVSRAGLPVLHFDARDHRGRRRRESVAAASKGYDGRHDRGSKRPSFPWERQSPGKAGARSCT